jgi:hypothetical protein
LKIVWLKNLLLFRSHFGCGTDYFASHETVGKKTAHGINHELLYFQN